MSKDNKSLGNFRLDGIPPAPRGVPQIEVTFDIDANGILHVSATDKGTGKEQKISITNASGLSDDEVSKMQEDAERNADADKAAKEAAESRNQLDNVVFGTEKVLKENGDKFSDEDKTLIQGLVDEGKKALESDDAEQIKVALEKINNSQELQQAMARMYQEQAAAGGAGPEGAGPQPGDGPQDAGAGAQADDNVVDAEVEDVEENK
jgi:molecular chaperone DnaK